MNVICPGWIDTPGERKFFSEEKLQRLGSGLPWGRLGRPEEIARGVAARQAVERDETSARVSRRTGLVITDVPGAPDSQELEIDPTGVPDCVLIVGTMLGRQLHRYCPIWDVDVARINVYVRKQILVHKAAKALWTVRTHRVELVEVESHDVGKVQTLLAVHADELAVDPDRRRAGGEPQDGVPSRAAAVANDLGHASGDPTGDLVVFLGDDRGQAFRALGRGASVGGAHG